MQLCVLKEAPRHKVGWSKGENDDYGTKGECSRRKPAELLLGGVAIRLCPCWSWDTEETQTFILGGSSLPPFVSSGKQDDWDMLEPRARARKRAGRRVFRQRAGRSRF